MESNTHHINPHRVKLLKSPSPASIDVESYITSRRSNHQFLSTPKDFIPRPGLGNPLPFPTSCSKIRLVHRTLQ